VNITDEMLYAATCAYEARGEYAGEPYAHDGIRAGLEAAAPLIAAQALRQAAEEIRRELVCCGVYEKVGPELQARNLAGENVEVSDKTTGGHQICYWGEAAAVIVEPR
jgi:hypothetical protein